MSDKEKVLLTGTCGFLMGNFIRKVLYEKQPYQFVSLDKVSSDVNSLYWNKNHTFHVADVRDKHIMDVLFQFETPDIVIHAAAEINNKEDFISCNIQGTQNVIDVCLTHKVKRLIYVSTDGVYGLPKEVPWKEDDCVNPVSPYAISKYAGEQLVRAAAFKYGLKYNIVRLSNSYGPRQSKEKFIPKVLKSILAKQAFLIVGSSVDRDWTHVFDQCSALLTVLNNGKDDNIYNASANQECTELEIAQKICNIMEQGHDLIDFDRDQFDHLNFGCSLDCSKIKEIGFEPKYKLKDGLQSCVEWLQLNQWSLR